MLVDDAAGVFGSTTPVVGGVGVLMSKFSGGGDGAGAGGVGVVVVVVAVPDGVVVVVAVPDGVVVVVAVPDGVVVVVVSGAVAVSGAAAAFDAAAPLVGVPGATPGVPGSYRAGGGDSGSAPLGIVCAPLVAGVGAGSACAVAIPRANTPDARTMDSTFMISSSFIPPCLTRRSVHQPGVHKQCTETSETDFAARPPDFPAICRGRASISRAPAKRADRIAPSPWPEV
jgi:hypothetical protein